MKDFWAGVRGGLVLCLLAAMSYLLGGAAVNHGQGPGFAFGAYCVLFWTVAVAIALREHFKRRENKEFARLQKHYQQAVAAREQEMAVLVSVASEAEKWQSDYLNFLWEIKHLLREHEAYLLANPVEAVAVMRKLVREAEAGLKK